MDHLLVYYLIGKAGGGDWLRLAALLIFAGFFTSLGARMLNGMVESLPMMLRGVGIL